jgi:PRTRC genetic system ThiF family protein
MKAPNLDVITAKPLIFADTATIHFWIIGCGGTGSFLVQLICRLAQSLQSVGKKVEIFLVDPDIVEHANITRQCFCEADVGLNKAQVLAARYSLAWALPIQAIPQAFNADWIHPGWGSYHGTRSLLIGCVDRASGRREIAAALEKNPRQPNLVPNLFWIDAGNSERAGQVLVGSELSSKPKSYQQNELGWFNFPAPSIQAPELLIDKPEEVNGALQSCAQIAELNVQSLTVNAMAATIAADLAIDLVYFRLKRYAVYFDQMTGITESRYCTPEAIADILARVTSVRQY